MKKDINFFESVLKDKTLRKIDLIRMLKTTIIACVSLVVVVSVLLGIMVQSQRLQIKNLEEQIERTSPPEKMAEILADKETLDTLTLENQSFVSSLNIFRGSPTLTTADIENIAMCQTPDMTIRSFAYSKGSIAISCVADSEMSGVKFVNRLRITKLFGEVKYSGVTIREGKYWFTVVFNVKESEFVNDDNDEQ